MDERKFDTGNNAKILMAVKNWVGSLCGTLLTELILSPGHVAAALDNILSGLSVPIARRRWEAKMDQALVALSHGVSRPLLAARLR